MRDQWQRIEPVRLHHQHEPAHPFLPAGAKCSHDFVIAKAGCERVVRNLKFSRVNAEAAQRAAGTQRTQRVLKRCLKSERFDCHICAAAGELLDFSNDVARLRIE